jgi:hypothetical protein
MTTTPPSRSLPVFSALLCAAPASWLVMMATGALLMSMAEWQRVNAAGSPMLWDEFLAAFLFAASLPFALVIVAVYLPVIVAMRQARLPGQPVALFALAGMLAGPVAGVLLLALGHLLFGARFQPEPTLWQLLGRVFGSRLPQLLPPMVALMLGGAVFGSGFAWACRYGERAFGSMGQDG